MTHTVLRIDASARRDGSVSRELTDRIISKLNPDIVITRDLSLGVDLIDEAWTQANFTPAADRSDDQNARLAASDTVVAELQAADTIVIGVPIYNFSVPTVLRAWVDLVARAGVTFNYSENGPQGLLTGKRAIFAVASGGTEAGSDIDFATTYLRHIMRFIGITDVEIVAADRMMVDAEASRAKADAGIDALAA